MGDNSMKIALVVALVVITFAVLGYLAIQIYWTGDTPGHFFGAHLIEHLKHRGDAFRFARFFRH